MRSLLLVGTTQHVAEVEVEDYLVPWHTLDKGQAFCLERDYLHAIALNRLLPVYTKIADSRGESAGGKRYFTPQDRVMIVHRKGDLHASPD